jgi:hypothetical protein
MYKNLVRAKRDIVLINAQNDMQNRSLDHKLQLEAALIFQNKTTMLVGSFLRVSCYSQRSQTRRYHSLAPIRSFC